METERPGSKLTGAPLENGHTQGDRPVSSKSGTSRKSSGASKSRKEIMIDEKVMSRATSGSRAPPKKPHEPDPFLAVDFLTAEQIRAAMEQAEILKRTNNTSRRPYRSNSLNPSKPYKLSTVGRMTPSKLRPISAASSQHMPIFKPPSTAPKPNYHIKSPFKHAVNKPEIIEPYFQPNQEFKEKMALATYYVKRVIAQHKPTIEPKIYGRLLKGKLKPLDVVRIEGPSIDRCRGVVSETRTYARSVSRALADRKHKISHHHDNQMNATNVYDNQENAESIHRTSIASDLSEHDQDIEDFPNNGERLSDNQSLSDDLDDLGMPPPDGVELAADEGEVRSLDDYSSVTASALDTNNDELKATGSKQDVSLKPKEGHISTTHVTEKADQENGPRVVKESAPLALRPHLVHQRPATAPDFTSVKSAKSVRFADTANHSQQHSTKPTRASTGKSSLRGGSGKERPVSRVNFDGGDLPELNIRTEVATATVQQPENDGDHEGANRHAGSEEEHAVDESGDKKSTKKKQAAGKNSCKDEDDCFKKPRDDDDGDNAGNPTRKSNDNTNGDIKSDKNGGNMQGSHNTNSSGSSGNGGNQQEPHEGALPIDGATDFGSQAIGMISSQLLVASSDYQTFSRQNDASRPCSASRQRPFSASRMRLSSTAKSRNGSKKSPRSRPTSAKGSAHKGTKARLPFGKVGQVAKCLRNNDRHSWNDNGPTSCDSTPDITLEIDEVAVEKCLSYAPTAVGYFCDNCGLDQTMCVCPHHIVNPPYATEAVMPDGISNMDDLERMLMNVQTDLRQEIEDFADLGIPTYRSMTDTKVTRTTNAFGIGDVGDVSPSFDYEKMLSQYRTTCITAGENYGEISSSLVTPKVCQPSLTRGNLLSHIGEVALVNGSQIKPDLSNESKLPGWPHDLSSQSKTSIGTCDLVSDSGIGSEVDSTKNMGEEISFSHQPTSLLDIVCNEASVQQEPKYPANDLESIETDLNDLVLVAKAKELSKSKLSDELERPAAPYPPLCFRINARAPPGHLFYFAYGTDMNPRRFGTFTRKNTSSRLWALLFGFQLKFNKKGCDTEAGGFPNIEFNPFSSVEGVLYTITKKELTMLDQCVGYPQHYTRAMLPVWMANCPDPDNYGVAQYCVPALTYIAQDRWIHKDPLDNEYSLGQCMKSADMLTSAYKEHLLSMS